MKKYLSNISAEKSIYLSKVFGGLTVCVAALSSTVLKSENYMVLIVILMAAISVYFRLTAGDEKLRQKTIYLLLGIAVFSAISLGVFFTFCV